MDTKLSTNRKLKRMLVNILSIVVVLTLAFPAVGSAYAQEPSPYIRAHPVWDSVDAWFWPQDATLHLTIDDPATSEFPDFAMDMPGEVDPNIGSVWFEFLSVYDLKPGDLVIITDGVTTRSLVVSILSIDAVDVEADTVSGMVEPETQLRLPALDTELLVSSDSNGYWFADFKQIGFDLMPGTTVIAEVFDEDGDNSSFEWWIPSPWLTAFPERDFVESFEWPMGTSVHLMIDDPGTEAAPDLEGDDTAEPSPWGDPRSYVSYEFAGTYDLKPGDELALSDGMTERTLVVQNLSITSVDIDVDTVTGTADPGAIVNVWPHETGEQVAVTTNDSGVWKADLAGAYDIVPGSGGRAEILDDLDNGTAVDWYVANPRFTVFPEWEWFDGLDWPDRAIVSISVEGKSECYLERESWGGFFNGNFPEGCNVEAGDTVTFDDGTTNRWHTVRNLYVTDVDTSDNTVTGKADAGETVYVWPHDGWFFEPLEATPNALGAWQVDLDDAGYAIREDSEGRSEIRDGMGNATASDWHVAHPHFTVFPEWEWFDGLDWPNEAMVTITVADKYGNNKPECETAKESRGYFFNGSFGEGCDVEIGDVVTFTDGETNQIHTVQNLTVTKANYDDDTVKGIADPEAEVYVWPHATGEQQLAIAKTQGTSKGKWNVDFSGIYDLVPGECGRSEIRDEFANSTAVDWCIPNPRIVAAESGDWFWTTDFKPGDLDIYIYDSLAADANLLWSGQQVADGWGFAFVGSDIHGQDLVSGNYLVVSDGDSQKTLVLQPISVTMFDTQYEFMAGFAPAGSEVWAAAGPEDWQERIMVVSDPVSGEWFADFAEIGFDITEDMQPWSYAHIYDEDGDANEGNVPSLETWIAVYTYDYGTWEPVSHDYYLGDNWGHVGNPVSFGVAPDVPQYEGYALLRGAMIWAQTNEGCQIIDAINPAQSTRFHSGWHTDYPMTYEQAAGFFDTLTPWVVVDDGEPFDLLLYEIIPFSPDTWQDYFCTFTE